MEKASKIPHLMCGVACAAAAEEEQEFGGKCGQ